MTVATFRQAGRFLSVGVANTFAGLMVIYATKWFLHLGDIAANVLGYAVGLSLSFALNSRWTFAYRGPYLPALGKFLLVILVAYGINLATVMSAIQYFGINDYFAQTIGVVPFTLTSYFGSKCLVFRSEP